MAPPPSRRPGYNRKAQYGLFASYVIAVAGALLGLLLAIISIFDPTGFGVVRNMTAEITRPVSLTLQGGVGRSVFPGRTASVLTGGRVQLRRCPAGVTVTTERRNMDCSRAMS